MSIESQGDYEDTRYAPLGNPEDEGLSVRFEPGFGLNVYIELRSRVYGGRWNPRERRDAPLEVIRSLGMSIIGWERVCEFVDEWRAREDQGEHRG